MGKLWKAVAPGRRPGLLIALVLVAGAQTVGIPRLRAALRGETRAKVGGQSTVTMVEQRHSGLRTRAPSPVAGSLRLSPEIGERGQQQLTVTYLDQWREEVARGTADVAADGTVALEVSQQTEAPRPWWRCRAFPAVGCTAYAVEIDTLELHGTVDADGFLSVRSLRAQTRNLIRERAGADSHDDAERWTQHVLANPVRIALD